MQPNEKRNRRLIIACAFVVGLLTFLQPRIAAADELRCDGGNSQGCSGCAMWSCATSSNLCFDEWSAMCASYCNAMNCNIYWAVGCFDSSGTPGCPENAPWLQQCFCDHY